MGAASIPRAVPERYSAPPPQVHALIVIRTILYDLCTTNISLDAPSGSFNAGEGIIGEITVRKPCIPATPNPTPRTTPEKYRYVATMRGMRERI